MRKTPSRFNERHCCLPARAVASPGLRTPIAESISGGPTCSGAVHRAPSFCRRPKPAPSPPSSSVESLACSDFQEPPFRQGLFLYQFGTP